MKYVVVLVDVPAQQLRQDHAVAQAGDREQLREPLQQAEHDSLAVRDRPRENRQHQARAARPDSNQAKMKQPMPRNSEAMRVLDVVV